MAITQLIFRKAAATDAEILVSLVRSAYRGEDSKKGWTTEADLLADERIDIEGMLVKINEADGAVLLAYSESGDLVACCELLKRSKETAYFGMFAVSPLLQAGGIGRQVLERAEQYAREMWGAKNMEMSVIWTREELIAWYIRRGYRRTGEKRPFPYDQLVNGAALRDDLYFEVLTKSLLPAKLQS